MIGIWNYAELYMDIILMGLRLIINQSILDDFISPVEQQKSNYSIRVQSFAQLYLYVPLHQKKYPATHKDRKIVWTRVRCVESVVGIAAYYEWSFTWRWVKTLVLFLLVFYVFLCKDKKTWVLKNHCWTISEFDRGLLQEASLHTSG